MSASISNFHSALNVVADVDKGDIASAVRSIWEFLYAGGFFMLLIALCSVFAITVIIYKALSLTRNAVLPPATRRAIQAASDPDHPGGVESFRAAVGNDPSPLGRIASVAVSSKMRSRDEAQESVQSYARAEIVRLDGGIPALDVVITIAPLLGLLGTVAGLVAVFGALGDGNIMETDPTKLAAGIARALGTTIAGIVVAVPTVIAHSYFCKRIEKLAVEMEIRIGALVNRLHPPQPNSPKPPAPALAKGQNAIGELANAVAVAASPPASQNRPAPPTGPKG